MSETASDLGPKLGLYYEYLKSQRVPIEHIGIGDDTNPKHLIGISEPQDVSSSDFLNRFGDRERINFSKILYGLFNTPELSSNIGGVVIFTSDGSAFIRAQFPGAKKNYIHVYYKHYPQSNTKNLHDSVARLVNPLSLTCKNILAMSRIDFLSFGEFGVTKSMYHPFIFGCGLLAIGLTIGAGIINRYRQ